MPYLTLCILMDFPIHIDAISMDLLSVHFNGVTSRFFNECLFLSLEVVLI